MELDDQPVCSEEDLAVMNWPAPAGELEAAACAAETNAVCVPKAAPHFSHADAPPPAALRWVASVFATNERMAAAPPRPTDEWWNEVRRCEGRLVAYELVPGNAPVMPYGDIDVKLRNIASDKGSAFLEKTNMVALSKSLCRAILPAITTFAERAPWAAQGERPEVMLFAAPGHGVVSAHWLIRNVRHFTSHDDVRVCVVQPLEEVLVAATDEWRRAVVAMAAGAGAEIEPDKLRAMLAPDYSVYKKDRKSVQKWRTPFASKEKEDRPFLYFDPDEADADGGELGALVAAHEMNEASTIHNRCHVTTVGVYEAEKVAFVRQVAKRKTEKHDEKRTRVTKPTAPKMPSSKGAAAADLGVVQHVMWEVAAHVIPDLKLHFAQIDSVVIGADPAMSPYSLTFDRLVKGVELHCPICKRTHRKKGFSVHLRPTDRRATVYCFGIGGHEGIQPARVECSADLGPWSKRMWPGNHPAVPLKTAEILTRMGRSIPTLAHPWLQRANPMWLTSVLIPVEELNPTEGYDILELKRIMPIFLRKTNRAAYAAGPTPLFESTDAIELAMAPLLWEWCRLDRIKGEMWTRALFLKDGTWHSTWDCFKEFEARRRWPQLNIAYLTPASTTTKATNKKKKSDEPLVASPFTIYSNQTKVCGMKFAEVIPYNDMSSVQQIPNYCLNIFDRLAIVREDVADIDLEAARIRTAPWFFHLFHRVCRDYIPMYVYVRKYLAFLIQKCIVSRKMLVMISAQGAGKGIILNPIVTIIGKWNVYNAHSSDGFDRFNSHLTGIILVFADEALFVGDKKLADKLKGMVTSDTIEVEAKFMNRMTIANTLNWILASNHDHAITSDEGNRRACVLNLLGELAGNQTALQRKVTMEIIDVSPRDLARVLYADDLRSYDPTLAMPPCDGTTAQTRRSLSGTKAWLLGHYINNSQWVFVEDPPEVPKMLPPRSDALWADYTASRPSGHGNNRAAFFDELKALTCAAVTARRLADENADIAAGRAAANPKDPRHRATADDFQSTHLLRAPLAPTAVPCIEGPSDARIERLVITRNGIEAAWPSVINLAAVRTDTLFSMDKWQELRSLHGADCVYTPPENNPDSGDDTGFGIPMPSEAAWELMVQRANPPKRTTAPPTPGGEVACQDSHTDEETFAPLPQMELDDTERGKKHSCIVRRVYISEEVSISHLPPQTSSEVTKSNPLAEPVADATTTSPIGADNDAERRDSVSDVPVELGDMNCASTPMDCDAVRAASVGTKRAHSTTSASSTPSDYKAPCYERPMEILQEEVGIAMELTKAVSEAEKVELVSKGNANRKNWPARRAGSVNTTDLASAVYELMAEERAAVGYDDMAEANAVAELPSHTRIALAFGAHCRKVLKWKHRYTTRRIDAAVTKKIVMYQHKNS